MAVSGTMAISLATLKGGASAVNAQRGQNTWGANYVFASGGAQNDIGVLADLALEVETAKTAGPTIVGSGVAVIGSAATPIATSGLYINAVDGTSMQLVVYANGLVSGVVA